MRADWGTAEAPLSDVWPTAALPPEALPSVLRARQDGWFLAPDAPLWCFLPAVWPTTARAWVPDRSVREVRLRIEGGGERRVPWSPWDVAEVEQDVAALLAACGLGPRPLGRLWLLRPPPVFADLEAALEWLVRRAEAEDVPVRCGPELVALVQRAVGEWFDR
ncbi:MAG: hypothetical protein H5T83_00945 [Actinotalea sp.]|nr:hypothetical protein [Actinotalea sp.]